MGIPQDMGVPSWIVPDAKICYLSRSTGQRIEVVVEMVNTTKGEVEISSAEGVWKVIPFALIASAQNPLFPPEALPPPVPAPGPQMDPGAAHAKDGKSDGPGANMEAVQQRQWTS